MLTNRAHTHTHTHTHTIRSIYNIQTERGDMAVIPCVGCSKNTHSWDDIPANESELTIHTLFDKIFRAGEQTIRLIS